MIDARIALVPGDPRTADGLCAAEIGHNPGTQALIAPARVQIIIEHVRRYIPVVAIGLDTADRRCQTRCSTGWRARRDGRRAGAWRRRPGGALSRRHRWWRWAGWFRASVAKEIGHGLGMRRMREWTETPRVFDRAQQRVVRVGDIRLKAGLPSGEITSVATVPPPPMLELPSSKVMNSTPFCCQAGDARICGTQVASQ
jgi:hypothetical protein